MSRNVYIPTQVIIQLENQIQPPQWGAPLLIAGANVVTNDQGQLIYQPAFTQRPVAEEEFTEEMIQTLNMQLNKLGLVIQKTQQVIQG